tara:strand:- start:683 stop:880 length:198 start_codon:yes stop_codon:yes gene_type:complete
VNAYLSAPKWTPAPAVVLFHECWGVNDAKRLMGWVGRVEAIEVGRKWLQSLKSQEMVNGKLATIG